MSSWPRPSSIRPRPSASSPPWPAWPVTSAAEPTDEFETIERLFRPLAQGAPEARGLLDDVAVIPCRPGQDLVATKDAGGGGGRGRPGGPRGGGARGRRRGN